jgi:sugar-specific transcriptional regulator TrmB
VIKALRDLGLSDLDAKVYIFLGKKGLQKGQDIARSLKVHKQQVYRSLKNLQEKGIVSATLDHPACYSAEPFQKVIDLFIRAKMEEAQHLRQSKDAILSDWQSIVISENGSASEKFTVIKGRNIIYSKIQQMIQQTKKELSTITSIPYLVQADQFGLFDTAFGHPMKDSIQLRFLTELSTQDAKTLKKLLKRTLNQKLLLKVRVHDLGLKLPNRMVIRDDEEAIFFINTNADSTGLEQDDVCLWTNSKSLVNSFSAVFEDLWETSIELEKRIVEIETGKPSPKTCVISDAELAFRKYQEILHSAKEEIIIMTSPEGLVQERESLSLLKDWASRGLSVKIMAPIVNENLQAAQDLSICSEVRHISPGYPEITVVDGKHIFQFKKQPPDEKGQKKIPYFGNTFYSNDFEYVERTRSLMNDIWRDAFAPSAITLESINKPAAPAVVPLSENEYAFSRADSPYKKTVHGIDEKPGVLTEKDVLNQIINAKKYPGKNWPKDIVKYYGSNAMAIIHPPDYLNLPDMMLWLLHYNKQSSFGAEDFLLVYVWLETAQGYAYVPATLITDNPKSVEFWKTVFAGTPAGQNTRLVKKGELQVRMHSNIFFAGWTVPVPLLPPKYTLPPSSMLFEGYSKLKPGIHLEYAVPSGVKVSVDSNGFDAFVTFFHPSTKYSGPGTDGVIGRDTITTLHPP